MLVKCQQVLLYCQLWCYIMFKTKNIQFCFKLLIACSSEHFGVIMQNPDNFILKFWLCQNGCIQFCLVYNHNFSLNENTFLVWSHIRNKKKGIISWNKFSLDQRGHHSHLIYPKCLWNKLSLFFMKTKIFQKANRAVYSCA